MAPEAELCIDPLCHSLPSYSWLVLMERGPPSDVFSFARACWLAVSRVGGCAGNRKLLQAPTPAVDSAYQFDPYNDFSASDFSVQYNVSLSTS